MLAQRAGHMILPTRPTALAPKIIPPTQIILTESVQVRLTRIDSQRPIDSLALSIAGWAETMASTLRVDETRRIGVVARFVCGSVMRRCKHGPLIMAAYYNNAVVGRHGIVSWAMPMVVRCSPRSRKHVVPLEQGP